MEAALEAAEQMEQRRHELRQSLALEAEQARYEARLAARRYEAVDPDQRLVAVELEARWNAALQKTCELEHKLQEFDLGIRTCLCPDQQLPGFDPQHPRTTVTLQEAAQHLQVSEWSVRQMIVEK
jgi:hypothetical protein